MNINDVTNYLISLKSKIDSLQVSSEESNLFKESISSLLFITLQLHLNEIERMKCNNQKQIPYSVSGREDFSVFDKYKDNYYPLTDVVNSISRAHSGRPLPGDEDKNKYFLGFPGEVEML